MDYRKAYGLPERYFLSLGRMVEKKNLSTLVEAYARFARASGERSKVETGNLKPELPETAEGGDDAATSAEPRLCETGLSQNCELKTEHCLPALVFVGSGELEGALREQARSHGMRVIDRTDWKSGQSSHGSTRIYAAESARQLEANGSERRAADRTKGNAAGSVIAYGPSTASGPPVRVGCEGLQSQTEHCKPNTENSVESDRGAVYFYGFRQIEENPVFYALADAFILPSLKEEWGLVVNEAMACSLPVIVSRTAGCAEDLLPGSGSMEHGAWSMESGVGADTENCKLKTENSLEQRSNGFVFDPRSCDALATALARVAEMGDRRSEMGRRSREIVAKFSCENFARQALRAAEAASA